MEETVRIEGPEWINLKHNSQFQLFLEWLRQTVRAHQDSWANREFEADDIHVWNRKNAAALGRVMLCYEIINIFDELTEGKKEENNEERDTD